MHMCVLRECWKCHVDIWLFSNLQEHINYLQEQDEGKQKEEGSRRKTFVLQYCFCHWNMEIFEYMGMSEFAIQNWLVPRVIQKQWGQVIASAINTHEPCQQVLCEEKTLSELWSAVCVDWLTGCCCCCQVKKKREWERTQRSVIQSLPFTHTIGFISFLCKGSYGFLKSSPL